MVEKWKIHIEKCIEQSKSVWKSMATDYRDYEIRRKAEALSAKQRQLAEKTEDPSEKLEGRPGKPRLLRSRPSFGTGGIGICLFDC